MKFLRKYRYYIFIFTVVVFLGGMFAGFGSYFLGGKGSPTDAVIEVAGDKIPLRLFYSHFDRAMAALKPGTTLDDAGRRDKRDEVIRELVQQAVFTQQAKQYGIAVPDAQVISSLAQIPAFQNKGQFSPELYGRALEYQLKSTPQDFEEEQRQEIAFYKLRWLIQSTVKVTDAEAQFAYAFQNAGKPPSKDPKDMVDFRNKFWQEKMVWSFNQWFSHLAQRIPIKAHLDIIEGIK